MHPSSKGSPAGSARKTRQSINTQVEAQPPSSSRLIEHPSANPHSFRNKGSYLNARVQSATSRILDRPTASRSRSPGLHPSGLNQYSNRSPLKQIIIVHKNAQSPIERRMLEIPDYVNQETLGKLDARFVEFEQRMKERFKNLEDRATHLVSSSTRGERIPVKYQ